MINCYDHDNFLSVFYNINNRKRIFRQIEFVKNFIAINVTPWIIANLKEAIIYCFYKV